MTRELNEMGISVASKSHCMLSPLVVYTADCHFGLCDLVLIHYHELIVPFYLHHLVDLALSLRSLPAPCRTASL